MTGELYRNGISFNHLEKAEKKIDFPFTMNSQNRILMGFLGATEMKRTIKDM